MFYNYASLLSQAPLVLAETPTPYTYLTERHLQAVWFEQKYFHRLTTSKGEAIEILSPGIWNAGAGPDFLKAHIKIGSQEYHGDIELHLIDESWYHHHHHLDERYNQVVLHVSLWKPHSPKPTLTRNGQTVVQTYLEDVLTVPHARLVKLIDLDLYPYKKFIGSGKCARTLFRTLSEEKTKELFNDAARWRLAQKRSYLEMNATTPAQQLGVGIARALGYKNNANAFLQLYLWLSSFKVGREEEYLACALKACGFFDQSYQKKWESSGYYKELFELSSAVVCPNITLDLSQIRPLNSPIRRLVIMSKLLSTRGVETLYQKLMQQWDMGWRVCYTKKDWNALTACLRDLFPNFEDPYWNQHYTFESKPKESHVPLIGKDLKNEILVNAFLPLLNGHIIERNNNKELQGFDQMYAGIPASKTGKTRYLTHRFLGDTPKGNLLATVNMEQGAYQVHHDFCVHFEASCEGCPFVDRYKLHPTYSPEQVTSA